MNGKYATEFIVIVVYFLFMLATGILFARFNKKFGDYFRSGCQGTWWLVGTSVFMASFTAWTFTGAVGVAYNSGITVSIIFIGNGIGYMTNALWTAKLFRQLRATTGPEVVRERFDTATQQFYVIVGVVPGILMSSLTLWGVALFASSVFGLDQSMLIVVLGIVVLVYSTIGGLWGVMATDFLQALILMPMTILVALLSLHAVGGIGGLFSEIHAQNLDNMLQFVDSAPGSKYPLSWAVALIVFALVSFNSVGASVRFFACKDGREASRAAMLASILMFAGAFLWMVPAIVARLKFSDLVAAQPISNPSESAYAVISTQLLPAGLTGMIVVAMFAATMSSLSTQLNQFAAIITQDVYKPFVRQGASDRQMFFVGQFSSLIVGLFITVMAVNLSTRQSGEGLFEYMLMFGSLFGTPMVMPLVLALFIRKTPPYAAIISILASAVVSSFSYFGVMNGGEKWSYAASVFSIMAVGSVAFLATIPLWESSSEEYKKKVAGFYEKMHRPVNFAVEVGENNDKRQLQIVGYVSMAIGCFVMLTLFVPNTTAGRLQIIGVGGFVILFGLSLVATAVWNERRRLNGIVQPSEVD